MTHNRIIRRGLILVIALMVLTILCSILPVPRMTTVFLTGMVIGTTVGIAFVLVHAIIHDVQRNHEVDDTEHEDHTDINEIIKQAISRGDKRRRF